jgi:hypothetical protein
MADRQSELPLRRRRFTFSLVVVLAGELIGLAVVAYVVYHLV